jgi:hypothetical protein
VIKDGKCLIKYSTGVITYKIEVKDREVAAWVERHFREASNKTN